MKKLTAKLNEHRPTTLPRFRKLFLLLFILPFAFTSCIIEIDADPIGYDGLPGEAYLSIDWEYEQPQYLDVGTSDIPPHFMYGRNYLTRPGWYELYYEGEYWDGYAMAWYAWEIEYEIWRNYGSDGGPGYNGADGLDTYLTIMLSPFGPYTNRYYKSLATTDYKIIEETTDKIIVQQTEAEYSIKITYRKAESRNFPTSKIEIKE